MTFHAPLPIVISGLGGWRRQGGSGGLAGADSALTQLFSPSRV